jgi:hypothetical protein
MVRAHGTPDKVCIVATGLNPLLQNDWGRWPFRTSVFKNKVSNTEYIA